MVSFKLRGSFKNIINFFKGSRNIDLHIQKVMKQYAEEGLKALKEMTPKDTGLTASQWSYTIGKSGIFYNNDNIVNGTPVAILIQYGHSTRNGGYVPAVDYINPALQPIFDKIALGVWKEVGLL